VPQSICARPDYDFSSYLFNAGNLMGNKKPTNWQTRHRGSAPQFHKASGQNCAGGRRFGADSFLMASTEMAPFIA
jgi:hypothetical protein